uniref:Receptor for retinol uptake STRA6 n=1 Tax=Callorhinchus milii TaxID=7868 RepID=V9KBE9_CALMI
MASTNYSFDDDYSYWNIDYTDDREDPPKEIIEPCDPTVRVELYHICMAGISLAVLLALSFLVKRRRLCRNSCGGVPGLLHPVGLFEHGSHKGIPAAVFGLVFCSLCVVVLDDKPFPFIAESSEDTKEYWKILALLYYPALYYPLLACAAVKSKAGYLLGSLLSWVHCGIQIWHKAECPYSLEIYKYFSLIRSLPQLLFLAFLSLLYPLLLVKNDETSGKVGSNECLSNAYYTDYVKIMLRKKPSQGAEPVQVSIPSRIGAVIRSYIYIPMEGFRVPTKLVITMTVAIVSVYQVAVLIIVGVIPTLQKARSGVQEDVSYLLDEFHVSLSQNRAEVVGIVKYYFWVVEVCYLSAVAVSCVLTLLTLMRSMVLHRDNLRALYRGDTQRVFNCKRRIRPSRSSIASWMCFTGYQAAHVCLGLVIQQIVIFLCFLLFAFLIVIPILTGQNMIIFQILERMWPFWLTLILIVLLQHMLARFIFLQKNGETFSVTNRRTLYIFTYLLFTFNVLIGVIAAVWRLVLTALFNVIHFCRLDLGLLNRGVEMFDPGYYSYTNFLKTEVSQSHPVMKAFCSLLLHSRRSERGGGHQSKDVEEGIQLMQTDHKYTKAARSKRVKAKWCLLFTLLNNPSLVDARRSIGHLSTDMVLNGKLSLSPKDSKDELDKPEACGSE